MVYIDWNLSLINNFTLLFFILQLTHYFLKKYKFRYFITDVILSLVFAYVGLFNDDFFIVLFVGFLLLIQIIFSRNHKLDMKKSISLVMAANIQIVLSNAATYTSRLFIFIMMGRWKLGILERYQYIFVSMAVLNTIFLVWLFMFIADHYREKITQTRLQIEKYHLGQRIFTVTLSVFISFVVLLMISDIQEITASIQAFILLVFTVLIVFTYWQMIFFIHTFAIQTEAKEKMVRNKQLNDYLTIVQKQYTELRQFKHDFQNIMLSLDQVLKDNDSKQMKYYYNALLKEEDDLNNVQGGNITQIQVIDNSAIRSLLTQKFFSAKAKDIDLHFEMNQKNYKIDDDISIVRIIGILLDNAIEYTTSINGHYVTCAFLQTGNTLEITIDNKIEDDINLNKIFAKGYSTKQDHSGFGLANVEMLIDHSSNLFLDTKIAHGHLMITLMVIGDE